MPRTKDEALTEKRRNEILDAAARVFVRHGFHRASMRQICGEAKLSAGAVYNYFPSKDKIIEGLAAREQEEIAELAAYLAETRDARKALTGAIRLMIEEADANYARLYVELTAEAGRNALVRNRLAATDAALQECLLEAIRRGQADGSVTKARPAADLLALLTAVYEGFVGRLAVDGDSERKAFAKLAADAVATLLKP